MVKTIREGKESGGKLLFQLGVLIATFLLIALSVKLTSPPKPLGLDAPEAEFSSARAFRHIEAICKEPRMIGTPEHQRVAQYLEDELTRLGYEVDIQRTTTTNYGNIPIFANVTNVMGRIKGADNTKAVLIVGHYDTQPHTTGAADDGIALASMLESAEILKKNYTLCNDIIFLFTDAEEVGLLGAIAFVEEHPWVNDVGIVLNIEARGNKGTALSFEVSSNNGWIIKEFMKNVEKPFAGSMMYEVYKMLPNYTDFTIFKNKGLSGFNVAIVEGFENYHSPTDTPENLSLASLQHMGSYVVSVAKHFGNISLHETKANDLVYFNLIGSKMVSYPMSWNMPLLVIILILFALFLFLGFKRMKLSPLKILYSFLACIAIIAFTSISIHYLNIWIKSIYSHYIVFYSSNFYNAQYYFYAYKALTVALSTFAFYMLIRKISIFNLLTSVFIIFIIFSVAIVLIIPTASYLTYVPLVMVLIVFNIILWFEIEPAKNRNIYYLLIFLGTIPFIFVISPYITIIYHIFGLSLPIAGVGLLMLLLLMLLPLIEGALRRFKLYISLFSAIVTILFLLIAHSKSHHSEKQPLQSNVMYACLLDEGKSYWLSAFHKTDEWNQQFFEGAVVDSITEIYPNRKGLFLKNDAEFIDFTPPELNVLFDSIADGDRHIRFSVKSTIDAGGFELLIPNTYNISSIAVNSKKSNSFGKLAGTSGGYLIRCLNPTDEGMIIDLKYSGEQNLAFSIIEKKLGLPLFSYIDPMPKSIIKGVGYESYVTLVKCSVKL